MRFFIIGDFRKPHFPLVLVFRRGDFRWGLWGLQVEHWIGLGVVFNGDTLSRKVADDSDGETEQEQDQSKDSSVMVEYGRG